MIMLWMRRLAGKEATMSKITVRGNAAGIGDGRKDQQVDLATNGQIIQLTKDQLKRF